MSWILPSLVLLLLVVHASYASHFRGGSMSWKPVSNNQIELTYHVGFKLDHTEPGFEPCTPEAQQDGTLLRTRGRVKCDSCSGEDASKPLSWICDEADVDSDSAIGHNTILYNVPEGQPQFDISYEDCCWITLQSPVNKEPGAGSKGWKMLTQVNVHPRSDGTINSSPVSSPTPLEKYHSGCEYQIHLQVSDPDNDVIRCRYAKTVKEECPASGNTKACGPPTDGLKVNKHSCTLDFNTYLIGEGYHAVNLVIEDFARPYNRHSQPLSKVPLLFLLRVEGEGGCFKPTIIDLPTCKKARPGEYFEMVVRADPASGNSFKTISKIKTKTPQGMTASNMENDPDVPNRMRVTLSWYPTESDIGQHSVCVSALDSDLFTSGVSCTPVYVNHNPPLQPDPGMSYPAEDATIDAGETWVVRFSEEINRSKTSAFIRIVDPNSGNIIFEIDATNSAVEFSDSTIEFTPPQDVFGSATDTMMYELHMDSGVAKPKAGGCASEFAMWQLRVNVQKQVQCVQKSVELFVPNQGEYAGEECLIQVDGIDAVVSDDVISTPYRLCCPNNCLG